MLAYISQKPHGQTSPNFVHMSPVAMAQSASGSNAICNVLFVLW